MATTSIPLPRSFVEDAPPSLPRSFVEDAPAPQQPQVPQVPQQPQRLSDSLPQPDQVAQEATVHAGLIASALVGQTDPNAGTMSPHTPSIWDRISGPVREGAIGRALGISSETAEARKEDPSNPVLRFEAAAPDSGPGVIRGAAQFASGLTTPENLLMMAGTAGLGALGKQLGTGLVSRLISAGFSADMLHNAYQQIPALRESWNHEDWPQVRQQLVKIGLGTGMAALGVRHALKGGATAADEKAPTLGREAPTSPEQQYTSTGQPIRIPASFVEDAPKETSHAETKVQATDEGRPDASPGAVQPAAAGPATTGQAPAAVEQPRTQAQVAEKAEPPVSETQATPSKLEKPPASGTTMDAATGPEGRGGTTLPPAGDSSVPLSTGRSSDVPGNPVTEAGETTPPPNSGAPGSSIAPNPPEHESTGVYFGSGLGALEPLFRESKAEGDALLAKRNAALAAAKLAADTPAETKAGEAVRSYLTSERDLWAGTANQALDIVSRRVTPKIQDREALGIMREFRHRPGELQQFIDGSHQFLQDVDGGAAEADKNLAPLMPRMREALSMLTRPLTQRENTTDRLYTNIADKSLREGQAGGWLGSRWKPDEYVPHLLSEKGTGDVATPPSTAGRIQGKIGKYFGFGERRSDRYPTVVHAVADGIIPKTLDPSAAFTVHADKFAQARATHLLEAHLADSGLGKWGTSENAPEGWVQLAAHSDEFKKRFAFEDPNSLDPETGRGEMKVGTQGLFVPPFIDKALSPVTDPDYTAKIPGFAKLRTMQRGLKEAILGLSGFHLLTENAMAAADIGPAGMLRAFRTPRESLGSILNERDLIASGGTTSVQGSTMDAYRSLRPGTIPTRAEVIRAYIPGTRTMLDAADAVTRFTFGNVQRRFKIEAFALHRDAWMHDNPNATADQLADAKRGIASYVNGVYGGLHWENMGISRAMVEMGRFAFLAPDWSGSNIALAKYAFDSKPSANEIPLRNRLAGAVTKESAQARLSRAFWTKQLVGGLLGTQLLSLLFSGKMSPRPFQVYQGDDENGEGVYQNVLFRGSVGDLVNLASKMEDHGLLVGAGTFVGSKAAPVTKLGIHAITGRDDMGHEIAPKEIGFAAGTVRAAGSLASDISPVPLTLRSVQRTMMSDKSDKYLWSERMLGLFGPQAQHVAPDGMRMTKRGLAPARQTPEHSLWDEITTGKR